MYQMKSRRFQSLRPAGGNGSVGCLQQSAYEPILTKAGGKMNRIAFWCSVGAFVGYLTAS